ncbi:MAG: AAA family ATPase, partial [Candidatus Latescibacteria bacterium]|nr:AAA family ATPase [Candidatus Latescibacterota bacterium]
MDSNTPKYKDAVGYLLKLRDQKNKPWFSHVCDLAVSAKNDSLSECELNSLWACFLGKAAYEPTATLPKPPLPDSSAFTTARTLNTLQELSGFTNFKLLSDTLSLKFTKPVTIVFGTNGSGKSSLCEAIKVLANPDQPTLPLENVRIPATAPTAFSYKFARDSDVKHWKLSDGYGACAEQIKYFDSSIAIRHITGNADPESVVEIAPFRLEVFEYCGAFINILQRKIDTSISQIRQSIWQQMELARAKFADVPEAAAELINDFSLDNYGAFKQAVKTHTPFSENDSKALEENKIALDRLNTASSEQGLKLLRSEVTTLNAWKNAITEFCELAGKVSPSAAKQLLAKLTEKKQIQKELAKEILPGNIEFGEFKT